jgi:Nucleotidyl transferase AbiEii toxin, Type IV TA system
VVRDSLSKLEWTTAFFARFHLDAGVGDVIVEPLETIVCQDWLAFAGIESSRVRMIAREQQFAEKIHAYTLPRNIANNRVKDLVDMALLIGSGGLDKQRILHHPLPCPARGGLENCRPLRNRLLPGKRLDGRSYRHPNSQ